MRHVLTAWMFVANVREVGDLTMARKQSTQEPKVESMLSSPTYMTLVDPGSVVEMIR